MGIGCGSQFPALGINIGDIFYRTDRKITYQYIGGNARTESSWITLGTSGNVLRPYQAVSDPDSSTWGTLESGYTWFNTTESQLKMWNGSRIIPVIEADISACVETLTGNRTFTCTQALQYGGKYILDAGGSDRNFNPSGTFSKGFESRVINIGGENIVFDSATLAEVIMPGTVGIFIFDGTLWVRENI